MDVIEATWRALQRDHADFLGAVGVDDRDAEHGLAARAQIGAQRFTNSAHFRELGRALTGAFEAVDERAEVRRVREQVLGVFFE